MDPSLVETLAPVAVRGSSQAATIMPTSSRQKLGTVADPGCYPSRSRRGHLDGRQLHGFLVAPGMRRQHLDGRRIAGRRIVAEAGHPSRLLVASQLGRSALALQVATLDGWAGGCLPRRSWIFPGRDDHADIIPALGLDNLGGFLQLLARVF